MSAGMDRTVRLMLISYSAALIFAAGARGIAFLILVFACGAEIRRLIR